MTIARREPMGRDLGDGCREAWGQSYLFDAPREAPPAPPSVSLVTPTKKPSAIAAQRLRTPQNGTPRPDPCEKVRDRRDGRAKLQRTLRDYSSLPRVMACGSRVIPSHGGVAVWRRRHRESGGYVAHIQGVQKCGNVWACPVCSPKIRQVRAADLDQGAMHWLTTHGERSVGLLTLTIPHAERHSLQQALGVVRSSLSQLLAGRAWQSLKARWSLAYYVRAHDLTVGPNGWHPHVHAVLFFSHPPADADIERIEDDLYRRWKAAVLGYGWEPVYGRGTWRAPTREHGVQLELARSRGDVARYVCQVIGEHDAEDQPWGIAQEVMRADLKVSHHEGHRTPWQLLADLSQHGDMADLSLWREYEQATRGVHAVRWAKGLRAAVELAGPVSDSEAANTPDGVPGEFDEPELMAVIPPDLWRWGRRSPPEVVRLLTIAELGGESAVCRQLDIWRDQMLWEEEAKSGKLAQGGLDDLGYFDGG